MNTYTTDKVNVRILVNLLIEHGVRNVVISPGSRNAPLIVGIAREARLKTSVVIDERSAAFIALGMAVESQRPVAIVCTSGSAMLNYAPAIAEAYYREVPLVVITADRPEQWIDQDDSQTIHQPGALDNIVKYSCDIGVDSTDNSVTRMVIRRINDALISAVSGRQGPVHINIHLDMPLNRITPVTNINCGIHSFVGTQTISVKDARDFAKRLVDKRVLIVVGFLPPDIKLSRALNLLADMPNVVVMHEAQANVKGKKFIGNIDRVIGSLNDAEREDLSPQIVITCGGSLVSRFIKAWLRKIKGLEHWHVGCRGLSVDCFGALTTRMEMTPSLFFNAIARQLSSVAEPSNYASKWQAISLRAAEKNKAFVSSAPWSDLVAMNYIIAKVPRDYNLQLSNGTSVRYVQLCDYQHIHRIDANRGVSGIDGSTSTAVGASTCYDKTTMLITGDMSAQYDIAALSSNLITPRFKMVVLNNGGGGIFRFVQSTRTLDELDRFFAADVNLPIAKLADAYGFNCYCADNLKDLKTAFAKFIHDKSRPAILNVVTPGVLSADVLTDYFEYLETNKRLNNE